MENVSFDSMVMSLLVTCRTFGILYYTLYLYELYDITAYALFDTQMLKLLIYSNTIVDSEVSKTRDDITFHSLSYNSQRIYYNIEYETYDIMADALSNIQVLTIQ